MELKYVIWNMDIDKFWKDDGIDSGWSNRYYATKYTVEELSSMTQSFYEYDYRIVALIALSI